MRRILGQNLLITLISKGLSFVAAFYIIKILSKEDYALYNQVLILLTFLPYFEIAVTRGFFIEYPKSIHTRAPDESTNLFTHYTVFIILMYLILGSFIFIGNIPGSYVFCTVIFLQFLLSKFIEVLNTYYNSHLRMQQMLNIKYITDIITPVLTIVLLYLYPSAWCVFLSQTLIYGSIIAYIFVKNHVHIFPLHIVWKGFYNDIRFLVMAGFLIHITGWLDITLLNCDKIFITRFYDPVTIANYCFAWNTANFIFIIGASIVGPYSQYLFRELSLSEWEKTRTLIRKVNRQLLGLLAVCLAGALIFFPLLVQLKAYEKYEGTYPFFALLVFGNAAFAFMGIYKYYINAMKLNRWLLILEVGLLGAGSISFFLLKHYNQPLIFFSAFYVLLQLTFLSFIIVKVTRHIRKAINV